jgi:hypothetical protein
MTLFRPERISREYGTTPLYVQNSSPECVSAVSDITPERSANRNSVSNPHLVGVINVSSILFFLTYSDISNFEVRLAMQSVHLKDRSIRLLRE